MRWETLRPKAHERALHRDRGDWDDRLLGSYLADVVAAHGSRPAVVDGAERLTYAMLGDRVGRVAAALRRLGVGRGDVVAWQLPNWWEAVVLHHAVVSIGAVSNPLMPILRERELTYMLRQARPSVFVVPDSFRGFDFATMATGLAALVDSVEHVVVVRGAQEDPRGFGQLLQTEGELAAGHADAEPDDPVLLLYTSGTESSPKGAVHSHNTLGYEDRSIRELYALSERDVVFMPSPVGHITGVLYGLHLPPMLGSTVVLQDVWEAGEALDLIARERCTFQVGATPFLHGLAHHPDLAADRVSSLRVFACGGADVSPELVRHATDRLGCVVTRVYGSTEYPTATGGSAADPLEKRAETDGRVIGSCELRVRLPDGSIAGPGENGELQVRGPERMLGYLDPEVTARAIDGDGWFRTGDLGSIDDQGYVVISGREKDVILRGGENISAKEVEDLLLEHDAVKEVAIVAMPDDVMVERACAYVVPASGAAPDLEQLTAFLRGRRIANQKLPERLELVGELPRTASGKVQKFELRARIRAVLEGEAQARPDRIAAS